MIVKEKLSWIRLLFQFRGSSFEETWPRILVATLIAVIVTVIELNFGLQGYTLTTTPFTLVGLAIGIFLGFRNNAAYDRFWEGRKLWGALVNTSRNLARQAYCLISAEIESTDLEEFRDRFVKRVIAFVHALRHHLRDTDPMADIVRWLPPDDALDVENAAHRPLAILQQLGRDLSYARECQWLHELNVPAVDSQLVRLADILGACERIKNTPIPFTYTVLLHRMIAFYCLFLPFGLIDTAGAMTPIVVFLIAHAFFGLDAIGDEIEQPFGLEPNCLPLESISYNIENNLLELNGKSHEPRPLSAKQGVIV